MAEGKIAQCFQELSSTVASVCVKGFIYPIIKKIKQTRNITEGDEYPQLVPDNIHMYQKFKGP